MKTFTSISFLLLFIFILQNGISQNEIQRTTKIDRNYFYIGPVDLFLNSLQLGYERKLSNSNTIAFSGGLELYKKNSYYPRIGGNGSLQYRINLLYNKEAISTVLKKHSTFVYFAPFLHYRYQEVSEERASSEGPTTYDKTYINSGMGGLGFGSRFSAFENRFCLNLFAGGGLKISDNKGTRKYDSFLQPGYTGIAPKLEFQIGIAF